MARDYGCPVFLMMLMFFIAGTLSKSVDLISNTDMPVTEGTRVTFSCKTSETPRILSFGLSTGVIISWFTGDGDCLVLGTVNSTLYEVRCDVSKSMFNLDILDIRSSHHNTNVSCEAQFGTDIKDKMEGVFTILVNVPLETVEINPATTISLQENNVVNVSCSARSRPLPYFTWFVAGHQIHSNLTKTTYNDIIVTSTVLYTGNRTHNNNLLYCMVENSVTSLSANVSLNITYSPAISIEPQSIPIEGTINYNLSCVVQDSNPPVNSYEWYINTEKQGTDSVFTLSNLNRTDSNNYTCNATNNIGEPSSDTIYLDVLYKGSILSFNKSNSSMMEGDNFNAEVIVEGKPLPNVTWSYDRTNSVILVEDNNINSSLNITTTCEDTGNYTLSVYNGLVEPAMTHFRLEVVCEPRIDLSTNINTQITIENGEVLVIQSSFIAFPQPNITWYFTKNVSRQDIMLNSNISTDSVDALHTSILTIQRVDFTHSGQYIAVAHNYMGETRRVFTVSIIEPSKSTDDNVEAIVGGVLGAFVFLLLVACVVNKYRKKRKREEIKTVNAQEKNIQRSWTSSSSRDIDDIIKENAIEEPVVEPIEPMYSTNPVFNNKSFVSDQAETLGRQNYVYSTVTKISNTQSNGIADRDANTKL